jgi:hypothetical protein
MDRGKAAREVAAVIDEEVGILGVARRCQKVSPSIRGPRVACSPCPGGRPGCGKARSPFGLWGALPIVGRLNWLVILRVPPGVRSVACVPRWWP